MQQHTLAPARIDEIHGVVVRDRRAARLNTDAVRGPHRRQLRPATDEVVPVRREPVRGGELLHGRRSVAVRIDGDRDERHAARIAL